MYNPDFDDLNPEFIDVMTWALNTLYPLDGGPECMDAAYAFAAAPF